MAFLIFIFVKVQFEVKGLEICSNFVQCFGVVTFEVLYCPGGGGGEQFSCMKLPCIAKNLPNFKGRPWSNALLSSGKGDAGASTDYCLSQ